MTNLCTLPSIPVLKIMEFLAIDDILNLRLTCSRMLELSDCETFFKRVNVKVHDLSPSAVMIFKNLCDKYASVFVLKINYFVGDITFILACITDVKKMIINVRHLHQICNECKNIQTLAIDVYELAYEFLDRPDVDFRCLSKLEQLDNLVIGEHNERYNFYNFLDKSMLYDIFTCTKHIKKIKFMGHMRIEGQNFKRHPDEQHLIKSLKQVISGSHHITEWTFFGVFMRKGHIFQFPNTIKVLKCRSVAGFDFTCLANSSVEAIEIDGSAVVAKNFRLPNLKKLEIHGDIHDLGNFKKLFLPSLEVLNIFCAKNLTIFEPLLLPTLKTLMLDPTETLNDVHLKWMLKMLSKCFSLLCLVIDRCHFKSLDQSLRVSRSCLIDLLKIKPSLNIKIVYKWQSILISAKNFDVAVRKINAY